MSVRTIFVTSILMLAIAVAPAHAGDPNTVFNGRDHAVDQTVPAEREEQERVHRGREEAVGLELPGGRREATWKIHFAAFLKKPLNDVEYVIKFYEVGRGAQQLLGASEAFNDERGQRTIVSNITLEKKSFGVNKELLMTIENKGQVLASGRFKILGEGEKFTGKVNFSEDEAGGKEKRSSARYCDVDRDLERAIDRRREHAQHVASRLRERVAEVVAALRLAARLRGDALRGAASRRRSSARSPSATTGWPSLFLMSRRERISCPATRGSGTIAWTSISPLSIVSVRRRPTRGSAGPSACHRARWRRRGVRPGVPLDHREARPRRARRAATAPPAPSAARAAARRGGHRAVR